MSFLLEETSKQKGVPASYKSVSYMRDSTVSMRVYALTLRIFGSHDNIHH